MIALVNKMFFNIYRKLKGVSSRIAVCAPEFCTVYAVSKGKLSSIRPSNIETNGSIRDDSSETSCSTTSSSNYTFSSQIGICTLHKF